MSRDARREPVRLRRFRYAELAAREKLAINLAWPRKEEGAGRASLPPPSETAASVAEKLVAALARSDAVTARLQ